MSRDPVWVFLMRVVVVGAGVAGLATAIACARGGHDVLVLERDDTPMPSSPDAAFGWARNGAPQVRHSHAFLARLRAVLRSRAPDVLTAVLHAGATEVRFTENLPPTLSDGLPRPGDDELVAIACRRTTFEWVLRRCALAEPGVELRHGVAAAGLRATAGDVPRVTGVAGEAADVVVDARGPRSTSDAWLDDIGARRVDEQLHESGIVYFSRFYRFRHDAQRPAYAGPVAADLGYVKYAIFLGDNDTFSITYAIERGDAELRRALVDPVAFEELARALVGVAPWRGDGVADPITGVHVMAGLRNRYRPFVSGGTPVALGLLPVGDASVCTNPLYGRGCSLAFVHAFAFADALGSCGTDLDALVHAHAELTERELVPWFRSAVFQDEQAASVRESVASEDPRVFVHEVVREGLLPAMRTSPIVFRAFLRWFNLLATPDALMSDPEIIGEVMRAYDARAGRTEPPSLGPTREELLVRLSTR